MRVEQQNVNISEILKQSSGVDEKGVGISFSQKAAEKASGAEAIKSVNVKDATYSKPTADEKKTALEEIEESASMDAGQRKDQMVILAGTTSPEDYAKMQEEGFSLESTATNTIVTVTDKIKAELAKSGVDISCFGDALSREQLEAITGSPELARWLAETMQQADVPFTRDNMEDTLEAVRLAERISQPSEGVIKYLLDNRLEPTIDNFYKAEFSGSSGFLAKREQAQSLEIASLTNQIEQVIRQAGLQADDQTMQDSRWLIEQGVPFTEKNLQYLTKLKECNFPPDRKDVLAGITAALSEGKRPKDALLLDGFDMASLAQNANEVVQSATDTDLAYVIEQDMELTVQNLEYAIAYRKAGQTDGNTQEAYTERGLSLHTARRQLEEIRLLMTTQANYALLKKGIAIDTEPLERLVEQLKAEENAYYANLLRAQGGEASEENITLLRDTTEKIAELKMLPAYALGKLEQADLTVHTLHRAGTALRDTFTQANERYETMMTAPRADMGDSIQKAFRNVDDILNDLSMEASEANRRAVRILGYNELAITPENIIQMKAADEQVQRVFKNMTPLVVTELIKQGQNPLDMELSALNEMAERTAKELGGAEGIGGAKEERFAEYLWKLERNDAISQEERKTYIGIYRLLYQVEKADGAAVGALVNQGAQLTLRNLLTAVRTERRSGRMDYQVDDTFGEAEAGGYQSSITEQIEAAYQNHCLKDVTDRITPDRIKSLLEQKPNWEELTPEQLKEALEQIESREEQLNYAYAKEQLAALEQSAKASEHIYEILQRYDIPNTVTNVLAMEAMMQDRNKMFRQIFGKAGKEAGASVENADLEKMRQALLEEICESAASPKELGEVQEKLGQLAENVMRTMLESDEVTSLDVREMRLLSAQLSISKRMCKEEQYSVPVMVSDGVVNVSLKIVRGVDKKGTVDIAMESALRGKIAATFHAKQEAISGLVVADRRETKELLEKAEEQLSGQFGEETVLHFACMEDLDLNHFSGIPEERSAERLSEDGQEGYQAQTVRLYRIAESFIRLIRDEL
ncbi:MAG: DUF6240 domain-containing protein [Roseburia sp.]